MFKMNITALLITALLAASASTAYFVYKAGKESAMREQAIDGYQRIAKQWMDTDRNLQTLYTQFSESRESFNAMRSRLNDNDLVQISQRHPNMFRDIVNDNVNGLFNAIESANNTGTHSAAATGRN